MRKPKGKVRKRLVIKRQLRKAGIWIPPEFRPHLQALRRWRWHRLGG